MLRRLAALRFALRSIFRRRRVEEELDRELQHHLQCQVDEELRGGLEPAAARRAALRAMGPLAKSIEECRDLDRVAFIDDLLRDVKYAARTLRRSPGFAAVVLPTLAISIGAVVTVFSIVDAWLLRPLSFPQPDRLVIAFAAEPERPSEPAVFLPYRAYAGWKERGRLFEALAAAFPRSVTLTSARDAETVLGLSVTPEYFRTFGVEPFLGRTIVEDDLSGSPGVVLGYGLWLRQFGGSQDVIGKTIVLSSVPHRILGVMPQRFETRVLDMRFDFWTPLTSGKGGYTATGVAPVTVVGRLRNGVTIDSARAELAAIFRDVESANAIATGADFNRFVVNLTPLQADNTRSVRVTLLTVSAAVVSLLLIASMNVGTLILGRGLVRRREAAIRTAIGAGRTRLIRQFLSESLLIAVLGGAAGLGLAAIAIRLFVWWNPLGALPQNMIRLDLRVLAAAFIAIATTTVVCGLTPALRIANASPYDALRAGVERGAAAFPGQRLQSVLLAVQMSACVTLLVATILLIQTVVRLQSERLGFDPENLMVANVVLPNDVFSSSEKRNLFYTALAERVRALPGLRAVAAGTSPPLSGGAPATVNTGAADSMDAPRFSTQEVSGEFFGTLAIALRAGRVFDDRDRQGGPGVAILNTRAAQQLFGSATGAVGRQVRLDKESWREVVGVVDSVRSTFFNTLEWQVTPIVYRPASQSFKGSLDPTATSFAFQLHVRSGRPLALSDIRSAAAAVSSQAAITNLRSVTAMVKEATRQPAFRMTLLLAFGGVSLFLAAIGVYGLVAQAVTQRRREVAIRIALGARPSEVIATVSRAAFQVTIAGFGLGIAGALMLGQALQVLLYGVRPQDAASFLAAGTVLLSTAAIAALVPALRAVRLDPAKVLRGD